MLELPQELLFKVLSGLCKVHDICRCKVAHRRLIFVARELLSSKRWRVARIVALNTCAEQLAWHKHCELFKYSAYQFVLGLEWWSAEALEARAVPLMQRLLRHFSSEGCGGSDASSGDMQFLLAHMEHWEDMNKAMALLPAAVRFRTMTFADVFRGWRSCGWEAEDKAATLLCCCAAREHRGGGCWRGKAALAATTLALEEWDERRMGSAGAIIGRLINGSHDKAACWQLVLCHVKRFHGRWPHKVDDFLRAATPQAISSTDR